MKCILKKATKFRLYYGRPHKTRDELYWWDATDFPFCRKCGYCKKKYTPKRMNQKYCSAICTNNAWILRTKKKELGI